MVMDWTDGGGRSGDYESNLSHVIKIWKRN